MNEKENPEKAAEQAYLREYVINSFRKRGIEITLQDLIRQYQEICPDYAKQLTLVLGLPESEDR